MKIVEIVIKIDEGDLWDIKRFGPRFGMTTDDRAIRAIEKGVPLSQHREVKKLKREIEKLKGCE